MEMRRPLRALFALGSLGWPVGLFAFGGFDTDAGTAIIGAGCLLVLGSLAAEVTLRARHKRRLVQPGSE